MMNTFTILFLFSKIYTKNTIEACRLIELISRIVLIFYDAMISDFIATNRR